MTIIGVTGTRESLTDQQLSWLYEQVRLADELHHGACVGADDAAHQAAIDNDISIVVHPPENTLWMMDKTKWSQRACIYVWPPKPYLQRNRNIVNAVDRLIALPNGPRRANSGTWYTISYAEQIGKPLMICYPDGSITES